MKLVVYTSLEKDQTAEKLDALLAPPPFRLRENRRSQ